MSDRRNRLTVLILWGLLAVLTLVGCWRYRSRVDLPVRLRQTVGGLLVTGPIGVEETAIGGRYYLEQMEGARVTRVWQTRLLVADLRIGDTTTVILSDHAGRTATERWRLTSGSGLTEYLLMIVVCAALMGMSGFVLARQSRSPAALPLASALALLAAAMALDEPGPPFGPAAFSFLPGVFWGISYALMPAGVVWFASWFPERPLLGRGPRWIPGMFLAAGTAAGIGMATAILIHTRTGGGLSLYAAAQITIWILLAAAMLLFMGSLLMGIRRGSSETTRARIRWVVAGTVVGGLPPAFLVYLPQLLGYDPVLSRRLGYLFLLALPASLVIAVVRHGLLDIRLVLRRGIIYGPATLFVYVIFGGGMILAAYAVLDSVVEGGVRPLTPGFLLAMAVPVLFFHLAYEPLRKRAQSVVDRIFFRTRYDYSDVMRDFALGLEERLAGEEVLQHLRNTVGEVLTAEWAAIEETEPGRWSGAWPSVAVGAQHPGPRVTVPFDRLGGLVLVVGPARSGLTYHRYDRQMLAGLVRETEGVLRREILQRDVLEESAERRRIEELTRMKDDFLSLVSHDLRNPLAAISLSAASLSRRVEDEEMSPAREDALRIQRSAERAARMVERILHTARVEAGTLVAGRAELRVEDIFEEILERFELTASHAGIKLDAAGLEDLTVCADRDLLVEVLSNLVENAIKHSEPGKRVALEASSSGGLAQIRVRDEGSGMPADAIAGLFERGFSGTGPGGKTGFGLGLYLSRGLMGLQGGHLDLEETGHEGTTFILSLPEAPCAPS